MDEEQYEKKIKDLKNSHSTTLFLMYFSIGELGLGLLNGGIDNWAFFTWSWVIVYIAWKLSSLKK